MDARGGVQAGAAITLDASQQRAVELFESRSNVALFGRAGCGKSEVLRRMVASAVASYGREAIAITALAGSVAFIIGGQTLHSLFSMDTRPLSREAWLRETLRRPDVCRRLNQLRVVFVDEVCTVSSSLFSRLAYVMRRVAPPHMQHLPFGGCQLVGMWPPVPLALLYGCLFFVQLMVPTVDGFFQCAMCQATDWCEPGFPFYASLFKAFSFLLLCTAAGDPLQIVPVGVSDTSLDRMVFDCAAWRSTFGGAAGKVLCLTGNHRQAQDADFQRMLDRVRWGRAGAQDVNRLNSTSSNDVLGPVTRLRIKKVAVQAMNKERLARIASPLVEFSAEDVILTADLSLADEAVASLRSCVDLSVVLKLESLVILTRKLGNVAPGARGVVKRFIVAGDQGVDTVTEVECDFDGELIIVGRSRFSAYDSTGTELAFCEQIPLLLGWAITVHRAQGLTLDAVEIDFQLDSWSTAGLVYTALSRARSFSCLRVQGLRRDLIHASRSAVAYYAKQLEEGNIDPAEDGRPPIESSVGTGTALVV